MNGKLKSACLLALISALDLCSASVTPDVNDKYLNTVRACLDNLIEYGTDTYGPAKSPILVSIIDVKSEVVRRIPRGLTNSGVL